MNIIIFQFYNPKVNYLTNEFLDNHDSVHTDKNDST